jgi:general secretion pathway protein C
MPVMFLIDKINIFNGRMNRLYHILSNIVAISIIVYIGVDTFYRVVRMKYTQVDTKSIDSQVTEEETSSVKSSVNDYQTIIDRNIFSKISVSAQKGDADIDRLKSTALKLVLIGTIVGDNKTSAAIIEDTGTRAQGLYRIGDNIQNAVIKSILRKKVVLQVGNRDEVLTVEEAGSGSAGKASNITQSEAVSEAAQPSTAAAVERNITIPRKEIEASLKDLNGLLSQASIQPHSTDGEPDGLTITGIKAGSIFRKMGLRNGDIVKGVNNDPIKTAEDLSNMYNDLTSAPDISIQITRRGQERTFNYTIND